VPPAFFTRATRHQNYVGINNPLPLPAAVDDLYTIRKLLSLDHDPTCGNPNGYKCKMPTKCVIPDVVLNIQEHAANLNGTSMEVNAFVIEVVGSKDVWGRDEVTWKSALAATAALNFMERSYVLTVYASSVTLAQFKRNATNKRIDVTKDTFELDGQSARAGNQPESKEFKRMMKAMCEAVLDVMVGQHATVTTTMAHIAGDGFQPFQNAQQQAARGPQHLDIPLGFGCNWLQDRLHIATKGTDPKLVGVPYAKKLD